MEKHWIQSAINPAHRGALHKQLGVPLHQTIPDAMLHAAAQKGGKLGDRARLALALRDVYRRSH